MEKTVTFNLYFLLFVLLMQASCSKKTEDKQTTVSLFRDSALDCSWDQSGSELITYSKKEIDGYYDIHLANPDGSNDVCLTCNSASLPNKHICLPFWHPTGNWILYLAEKAVHDGSSVDALPGFGAYCDIWLMNKQATKFYKLVDIVNDYNHGVIAPRFSPDGTKLIWTDRIKKPNITNPKQQMGYWNFKIADFSFDADSVPVVSNIKTIQPGEDAFYECYGFSPDGNRLIFCSSMNRPSVWDQQIYTIDLNGNDLKQLTEKDYNEHGFYKPDGTKIVWMTNTKSKKGGTDWWMMDTDGNNKKQLTFFNEPRHSQYEGHAVWCGLGSFNAIGNKFIGGIQKNLITQEGKIVIVELH